MILKINVPLVVQLHLAFEGKRLLDQSENKNSNTEYNTMMRTWQIRNFFIGCCSVKMYALNDVCCITKTQYPDFMDC